LIWIKAFGECNFFNRMRRLPWHFPR
jgi:hypothetical protein